MLVKVAGAHAAAVVDWIGPYIGAAARAYIIDKQKRLKGSYSQEDRFGWVECFMFITHLKRTLDIGETVRSRWG